MKARAGLCERRPGLVNFRGATMFVRTIALMSGLSLLGLCAAPVLADQLLDPDTLPPQARDYALHGDLANFDPFGNPVTAQCRWTREQSPTAQGLKWMLREECNQEMPR